MLSLEDVKNYLRVDFDDDDAYPLPPSWSKTWHAPKTSLLLKTGALPCFLRWPISTNTEKKPITMRSP